MSYNLFNLILYQYREKKLKENQKKHNKKGKLIK